MSHTFLQLVTRLAQETGTVAPTTVVGQTGERLRLVNWINAAWLDIQSAHEDWDFLRNSFSFNSVSQQATYTAAQAGVADYGLWKQDSFRISTTSSALKDEMLAPYMAYATWRDLYQYGNMRTTYARPVVITITPDKQIGLGPTPDATGYTIDGEYFRAPYEMSADTDVPTLPDKYYLAIVYRAMMLYGAYESASEVYTSGETEFKKLFARMEIDQIVAVSFGAPLA